MTYIRLWPLSSLWTVTKALLVAKLSLQGIESLGIIYMSPSLSFSPLASRVVPGVSRPLSLAWACRSKPRQRLRPVRGEFSCGKLLVREALPADRSDETIQPLERMI